jgi:hypothetical protein
MTRHALAETSWGVKTEGTYTFQNQVDPSSDKGTLKPYSLIGAAGPYFRKEVGRKLTLGAEVVAQPGKNYLDANYSTDPSQATYKRSGLEMTGKVSLRHERGDRWWNPATYVGYDMNHTSGEEYRSKAFLVGASNALHLSDAALVSLAVDFSPISYNDRLTGSRSDKMLSLDSNLNLKLSEKYNLLADLQYINNTSNVADLYQYTRLVVSAGLGYSL